MKYCITLSSVVWVATLLPCVAATTRASELSLSPDQRYLLKDGEPFFYLCDTAWDLFMRLDREAADEYLKNRADKGFNVIIDDPYRMDAATR